MRKAGFMLFGVNGLHVGNIDLEMRSQQLKAYRR
jgi:hypothetical protein